MTFRVHDRVSHIHYPGTAGRVVAIYDAWVIVLWDELNDPANSNNAADLPLRTSRHMPQALERVAC